MPSDVDIVNRALHLIGGSRITSLDDGTKSANVANDIYDGLRQDLLRSHAWNFATKRKKLAQATAVPAFEFDHAYPLPDDWLRTVAVFGNDNATGHIVWRMENVNGKRSIVSSQDDIWIEYIADLTDPNLWTADFQRALQLALARDMAVTIAASNTVQDNLQRQADRILMRARSTDGMGSQPVQRPRGSWAEIRGRSMPVVGDSTE